jgi:hypothetical protein
MVSLRNNRFDIPIFSFGPHRVFRPFVWISEKTAVISYTALTESPFTKEKKSVHCVVGNEYITVI